MGAVVYGMEQVRFMTKQLIRFTKTVLREGGEMTLHEIMDAIKERWPRRTPTTASLSNVLAKNPDFIIMDEVTRESTVSSASKYDTYIWGLAE